MGFLILFNTVIILVLMQPQTMPRQRAPLVDFAAFRDISYLLYAIGIFLVLEGLYFAYYYVSSSIALIMPLVPSCLFSC